MTHESKIRNLNTSEIAAFLTDILTDQDAINQIYRETCRKQCPVSHDQCPVGGMDGRCPHDTAVVVKQWLETEA